MKLAYAEAKIALIRLYQSYTLRLTPGQVSGLLATSAHGLLQDEHANVYVEQTSICEMFITSCPGNETMHVTFPAAADRIT